MVNEDREHLPEGAENDVRPQKFSYTKVAEGFAVLVIFSVVGAAFGIWVRVDGLDVRINKAITDSNQKLQLEIDRSNLDLKQTKEEHKLLIFGLRKDLDVLARDLTELQDSCASYQQWQTGLYRNSDRLDSLLIRFDNLFSDFRDHEKEKDIHR